MKNANANQNIDYYQYVEDTLAPEDVHDAQVVSSANAANGLFLIVGIVATVLHAINLGLFLSDSVSAVIPIMIHIIISLVLCILTYGQYRAGMSVQHMAMLSIVSTMTGIFGAAGSLVGFVCTLVFRMKSQHFAEWYESIFPTDRMSEPQTIYDSIIEGIDENPSAYGVMPFADVMRLGSEQQKRRALAKMTSRFSPRFASAFRMALSDSSNTIRVQAATAIAKVERDFAAKLERIELARTKDPKIRTSPWRWPSSTMITPSPACWIRNWSA